MWIFPGDRGVSVVAPACTSLAAAGTHQWTEARLGLPRYGDEPPVKASQLLPVTSVASSSGASPLPFPAHYYRVNYVAQLSTFTRTTPVRVQSISILEGFSFSLPIITYVTCNHSLRTMPTYSSTYVRRAVPYCIMTCARLAWAGAEVRVQ